jgi:hypothetical protein
MMGIHRVIRNMPLPEDKVNFGYRVGHEEKKRIPELRFSPGLLEERIFSLSCLMAGGMA